MINSFLLVVVLVATVVVIAKKPVPVIEEEGPSDANALVIDEFKAGTYGGKEFKTQEDVVNYYKECYDYTKTLTADYKTDSNGYYELAIGQDGGVIANPNMSSYFQHLTALEEINLEKLDTFGVTNMTY